MTALTAVMTAGLVPVMTVDGVVWTLPAHAAAAATWTCPPLHLFFVDGRPDPMCAAPPVTS